MEWIKTKDRLPKDGDEVIFGANNIVDINERLQVPMVTAGWFMAGYFYSWLSKEKFKKVTHWQPMPTLKNGD